MDRERDIVKLITGSLAESASVIHPVVDKTSKNTEEVIYRLFERYVIHPISKLSLPKIGSHYGRSLMSPLRA